MLDSVGADGSRIALESFAGPVCRTLARDTLTFGVRRRRGGEGHRLERRRQRLLRDVGDDRPTPSVDVRRVR